MQQECPVIPNRPEKGLSTGTLVAADHPDPLLNLA